MAESNETAKEPLASETATDNSPRIGDLKVKDLPGKTDAAKPKPHFPKMGLGIRG